MTTLHVLIAVGFLWSLIQRATPIVDSVTGITSWNVNLGVGIYYAFLLLAILIPGAILFLHKGVQAKDSHVVRVRSITIGIGGILLIITAAIFYFANTETLAIIGDLASIAALLTVFLGVAYHRPTKQPAVNPPAQL